MEAALIRYAVSNESRVGRDYSPLASSGAGAPSQYRERTGGEYPPLTLAVLTLRFAKVPSKALTEALNMAFK